MGNLAEQTITAATGIPQNDRRWNKLQPMPIAVEMASGRENWLEHTFILESGINAMTRHRLHHVV